MHKKYVGLPMIYLDNYTHKHTRLNFEYLLLFQYKRPSKDFLKSELACRFPILKCCPMNFNNSFCFSTSLLFSLFNCWTSASNCRLSSSMTEFFSFEMFPFDTTFLPLVVWVSWLLVATVCTGCNEAVPWPEKLPEYCPPPKCVP